MKDIQVQLPVWNVVALFKRYHLTFFIIFITGILCGVVLLVNNVVVNPPASTTVNQSSNSSTQSTLSLMQSLHSSDELTTPPQLPTGKNNPFSSE
ncbi:hypothetical protein KI440_00680 [Candidatus Saccharibacteria bacterium TM7i]|nr:hypothetical protein KI440_00680 [Candidatus Saccharibacteria bacterium TM7i]